MKQRFDSICPLHFLYRFSNAWLCAMLICLAVPVTALAQACPPNPNPSINVTEVNETKTACHQTLSYDVIEDSPIFNGACLVAINRTIKHVTIIGQSSSTPPGGSVSPGGCTAIISTSTSATSANMTRQNPDLCEGETRTYEVSLRQDGVTSTTSQTTIGSFIFATHTNYGINTHTHTLHITEVGTKQCNVPITITEANETRPNPNLCEGETNTFDETTDIPQFIGNILIGITRFINHVTEVGTKQCDAPRCRFSLSPQSASFSPNGGQGSLGLKIERLDPDENCDWAAAALADWIEIISANSGQETTVIEFKVKPNFSRDRRDSAIRILGENSQLLFQVSQTNNPLQVALNDPAVCLRAGGTVGVTAYITNQSAAATNFAFTASLPPQLPALAGSCTATVGNCTISSNSVTWSGTLAPGQTIPINYQAQIALGTANGTTLTINNSLTFGDHQTASQLYSFTVNCPASPPAVSLQNCGASSFAVPRLTRGATPSSTDLFLLPEPLTMTITSSDQSGKTYPVTAATSNHLSLDARGGLLDVAARGLLVSGPNSIVRAVSCQDSYRAISFEIASTGALGDKVLLFRQNPDGSAVQDLATFTVQQGGLMLTYLHPQGALYSSNRLAIGTGQLSFNSLIPFETEAGSAFANAAFSNGRRTGLLTLTFNNALGGCFQFGADLSRADAAGALSLILTDVVVNRNLLPGDQPGTGLIGETTDSVPTGLPCDVACPVCPPPVLPNECVAVCFTSPARYRTKLNSLPNGSVWNFGELTRTSNTSALALGLQDGTGPAQRLNRGYVAAQLSLLPLGVGGTRAQKSPLSCYDVQFSPVILSNGVVLAPNITLGELMQHAQEVINRKRWGDAEALAAIFELLNRCE